MSTTAPPTGPQQCTQYDNAAGWGCAWEKARKTGLPPSSAAVPLVALEELHAPNPFVATTFPRQHLHTFIGLLNPHSTVLQRWSGWCCRPALFSWRWTPEKSSLFHPKKTPRCRITATHTQITLHVPTNTPTCLLVKPDLDLASDDRLHHDLAQTRADLPRRQLQSLHPRGERSQLFVLPTKKQTKPRPKPKKNATAVSRPPVEGSSERTAAAAAAAAKHAECCPKTKPLLLDTGSRQKSVSRHLTYSHEREPHDSGHFGAGWTEGRGRRVRPYTRSVQSPIDKYIPRRRNAFLLLHTDALQDESGRISK